MAAIHPGLANIPEWARLASTDSNERERPISRIRFEVTREIKHQPPDPTQHPLLHLEVVRKRIEELPGVLLTQREAEREIREKSQAQKAPKAAKPMNLAKQEIKRKRQEAAIQTELAALTNRHQQHLQAHLVQITQEIGRYRLTGVNAKLDRATEFALESIQEAITNVWRQAKAQGVTLPEVNVSVNLGPYFMNVKTHNR